MVGIFIYKLMLSWVGFSTLEESPANEVQRIRSIGKWTKSKLCSVLIGWLDFRTLGNVAGFWLMLHMSKWKVFLTFLTCFYGFMFINLIDF